MCGTGRKIDRTKIGDVFECKSSVEEGSSEDDWERQIFFYKVIAFRTGWFGAWDAIIAAIKRNNRPQSSFGYNISLYIKNKDGKIYYSWAALIEVDKKS